MRGVLRVIQARRWAMSEAERLLWERLRHRQLGVSFQRHVPVGPYVVDFLCRERQLVVELEVGGLPPAKRTGSETSGLQTTAFSCSGLASRRCCGSRKRWWLPSGAPWVGALCRRLPPIFGVGPCRLGVPPWGGWPWLARSTPHARRLEGW